MKSERELEAQRCCVRGVVVEEERSSLRLVPAARRESVVRVYKQMTNCKHKLVMEGPEVVGSLQGAGRPWVVRG